MWRSKTTFQITTEERREFHTFRLKISSECCPRNDGHRKTIKNNYYNYATVFFKFNNDDYRFIHVRGTFHKFWGYKSHETIVKTFCYLRCCIQLIARSPGFSGKFYFKNVTKLLSHISRNRQNSSPHRGPRRQLRERRIVERTWIWRTRIVLEPFSPRKIQWQSLRSKRKTRTFFLGDPKQFYT